MPITEDQILSARQKADQSAKTALDLSEGAGSIEQELKDALKNKLGNSGLITQKEDALSTYLASGDVARAKYASPTSQSFIFDPYQRDAVVSTARSQARTPYAALASYLGLLEGDISEIAQAGTNAYTAQSNAALGRANLDRQGYTDLWSQYQQEQDMALELAKLYKTTGASTNVSAILSALMGGGTTPTEPKPRAAGLDSKTGTWAEYKTGKMSPQGQWKFDGKDWVPTQTGGGVMGGLDMSDPRTALVLAAMGGADSFNEQISGINALYPAEKSAETKARLDIQAKQKAFAKAKALVDSALKSLDQGGTSSGWNPLYAITRNIPGMGDINPERTNLRTILSELAGPLAFSEAGKALTATELGLVGGKIPTIQTNEAVLKNQLNAILNNIYSAQNSPDMQQYDSLFSQVGL